MSERTPDQQLETFGRSLHLAGAGITIAIAAVVFAIGYWPVAAEELSTLKKMELSQSILKRADEVRATNKKLLSERSVLDERYAEVTARIPSHPDESGFLAQVTELARRAGIRVEGFRPGALRTQGRYGELEIGVTAVGDYQSLCRFLHGLPELSRFCHLVSLDVDASSQTGGSVPMSMQLRIYFNKSSNVTAGLASSKPVGQQN